MTTFVRYMHRAGLGIADLATFDAPIPAIGRSTCQLVRFVCHWSLMCVACSKEARRLFEPVNPDSAS
jgi:hypothetical protein